ncbi:2-succinyl-5-enolpyruvyl-6-hydroxy-3-cyclohexene-1-carboxylic-acid synthase [Paraferrimonas haliotis]|uniref:2-succinyl-5-enolpyruvyl-6-hydroxy-3-cyclohexene-1-carboxylate synthase n=1 Tax=Paraferrimonas haliotis TaxID=2013866 RepID=A0AA37TM62_9GAMM|nr:2-succinyl-5-enolpyruvyl-6-hydroxy-3-cyclohexene-1-carboxylic-acid synthase [Paraferrimonas haliotis]GLS82088.1 2-succinyl-5-enolpyruvyl-6-hydroxy-3-cyclohexene- 1-carboxylate synthase [Paraferrimonas haliotis]
MSQGNPAQFNLLWASIIIEELSRLGVNHICLAPGSRSTPLTLAAANHDKLHCHSHFDERGLGFLALGLAKAGNEAVAIITTSGTAVANLYPAIIEAYQTGVQLIVLSGDRPEELLNCGANQAINQVGIFGDYVNSINLSAANDSIPAASLLTQIDQVMAQSSGANAQPVHINCMFREPFYPESEQIEQPLQQASSWLAGVEQWRQSDKPYSRYPKQQYLSPPSRTQLEAFGQAKGVIVVGQLSPHDNPAKLLTLANTLGWPVIADAQSQLRQHDDSALVLQADQLLHSEPALALLGDAEHLLLIGGRLVSKRIQAYIASHPWQQVWQCLAKPQRLEPDHVAKQIWHVSAAQLSALAWPQYSPNYQWAQSLTEWSEQLEQHWQRQIDDGEFGEAQVIRAIAGQTVVKQDLFIGNSLPIRLFDQYTQVNKLTEAVFSNRGASGIDGLLATSCGISRQRQRPMTLVIGDLSQLHDLNSFALTTSSEQPLVVVIINNDGGNIFNLLPVPTEQLRQQYYRLQHGLSFSGVADMFHLPYRNCSSLDDFKSVYDKALQTKGPSIIEVTVSSTQASEQIKALAAQLQQH